MIEHAERPWGSYTVLAEGDRFKVKTLEVGPAQRLSYQRHERRAEHWFVVAGQGVITLDGGTIEVQPGDSADVPRGAAHRIQNTGSVPWCSWRSSMVTTSARMTSSGWTMITGG